MSDDAQPEAESILDIDDLTLICRALALAPDLDAEDGDGDGDDDGEDDGYWRVIRELHSRGTRLIFDEAARMTLSDDACARRLACDVLGQLGCEHGRSFGEETLPLLARICTEEAYSPVLAAAVSALGDLWLPETLAFVVAHARHPDPAVRLSVARALPSTVDVEWLDPTHPAVTTLMLLTTDDDADVRDWATFGVGTLVKAYGPSVRQCLLARVDDPDDDTRAEAIAGLARRHAPEIVGHIWDLLQVDIVDRLLVESAGLLGDPSFAEPLAQLATWWDVDVDLLEAARRRCDPARVDDEAALVKAFVDAAERSRVSVSVSSELLPSGICDLEVSVVGARDGVYVLGALMRRAGGSVDVAVQLIQHDLEST